VAKNIQGAVKLYKFLNEVLPDEIPTTEEYRHLHTRDMFIQDVIEGIKEAPMSIRLTPHILSVIDWNNPLEDPLRRQFIPMKSTSVPNHPKADLDSLHEADDSPVPGLVHRYPDKVLFLGKIHAIVFLSLYFLF
jgi:lysine 2,3-aminomutase